MNVRMKENEYIEKAQALVEAKKQYYATLSELSQLTPDEEERCVSAKQMYDFYKLLIDYRDRNEKIPFSLIGKTLGDPDPVEKGVYLTAEEAYKEFVDEDGIGELEYEVLLNSYEDFLSLAYLQPLRRVIMYITEYRANIHYDLNEDECRAMLSLVNDEDKTIIEECLIDYVSSKVGEEGNEMMPLIEDMANFLVDAKSKASQELSVADSIDLEQNLFGKMTEMVEIGYNLVSEGILLSKKEREILQPLLENPILVKYSKAGIHNRNSLVLPSDMFDNYAPDYTIMFGNSLESKFQNPSSISDFINYLGRNNYIDDDLTVKENLAYHITGVNRPTKVLEKIVWHGDTKNLFWLCKQMFGKYAKMKTVFVAPDDPKFSGRSGEYAERPTEEFKKMFNSLFR